MDSKLNEKLEGLEKDMSELKGQMRELYFALLGSNLTKDGGFVGRINELEKDNDRLRAEMETEVDALKKEVQKLKEEKAQTEFYVKVMWTMVGVVVTGIFGFVMQLIFKK